MRSALVRRLARRLACGWQHDLEAATIARTIPSLEQMAAESTSVEDARAPAQCSAFWAPPSGNALPGISDAQGGSQPCPHPGSLPSAWSCGSAGPPSGPAVSGWPPGAPARALGSSPSAGARGLAALQLRPCASTVAQQRAGAATAAGHTATAAQQARPSPLALHTTSRSCFTS